MRAFAGTCGKGRSSRVLLAALVALALTLGAGMPGASAWAANLNNPDVPTDDTGVVTPAEDQNAPEDETAGSQDEPATETEAPADAGQDASTAEEGEGEAADGESADSGEEGAEAAAQAPGLVADPVFGTERNPDNLVNPQQKPDSSFIYDTSISALQEADSYLNDQTVQVSAEVVGDRLKAEFDPGYCWIVLQSNEENYAEIPVFLTQEFTELIDTYGSYGRKGTTLQVRGTFHLACPEHEGLTDLHADTVSVVEKGSITQQVLDPKSFIPGGILVLIGGVMVLVFHRMREGQR